MRLVLLFSTFPGPTETFLQREVEAFQKAGRDIEIWSFWGGDASFKGSEVCRLSLWQLWKLVIAMPYWGVRSPRRFMGVLRNLVRLRWRNSTNFWENLLGFGYGFILARSLEQEATDDTVLHAVWASLPATIGWTVHLLTGLPFSFAGHAYDLFEDGGDALIKQKIASAFALRTSTEAGAARFREFGAEAAKVGVIRRGLVEIPNYAPNAALRQPIRFAAVGRFVPKMGYDFLADVLDCFVTKGLAFEIRIIGNGPERRAFEERSRRSAWSDQVEILGAQPFDEVLRLLRWADVLLFTGKAAKNGDQAGFPNILAEAMALGCSVIATPVGGVTEVIRHAENGSVAASPEGFCTAVRSLLEDDVQRLAQLKSARAWVEKEFDACVNMEAFWSFIEVEAELSKGKSLSLDL